MPPALPAMAAATGSVLLVLQMGLGLAVSGARGQAGVWIGAGGNAGLERATRRHANLAENAGLVLAGLTLLELSGRWPTLLLVLSPPSSHCACATPPACRVPTPTTRSAWSVAPAPTCSAWCWAARSAGWAALRC